MIGALKIPVGRLLSCGQGEFFTAEPVVDLDIAIRGSN